MLAGVGGVRNGAAKEDGHWDLNLGAAAIEREDHTVLEERRGPLGSEGEERGSRGLGGRRERIMQLWQSE